MTVFHRVWQFWCCKRGSLTITMAFILLALIGAVGGAVDLTNAMRQRIIAQRDLDAALLSSLRNQDRDTTTEAERADFVRTYMKRTNAHFPAGARITITQEDEDVYRADVVFDSDNILLSIVGIETFDVGVEAAAMLGAPRPMEMALVLDTTSSMAYGNKMNTMKAAARDLVTTLTEGETVRIALVPFAQHINVGVDNRTMAGLDIPYDEPDEELCASVPDTEPANCRDEASTCSNTSCSDYTDTCVSDGVSSPCTKNECRTDSTYACTETVCDQIPTGTSTTSCQTTIGRKWRGCVGSREYPANISAAPAGGPVPGFLEGSCAQPVVRLTDNGAAMAASIDALVHNGETYIAPALVWGSRMISPEAPFPDGTPVGGDAAVQKAIVLMSDGANTISKNSGESQHNGTDKTAADAIFREACDAIKAQGTMIFTVAYDINDPAARTMLENCASNSTMFFDARTDEQLTESFKMITMGFQVARIAR